MKSKKSNYENKMIGKIELNENKSLHFMITVRNYVDKFAQVRFYLKSARYTGYTKKGIILSENQIKRLKNMLSIKDILNHNGEIGVIDSGENTKIIVRSVRDRYTKFKPMIDIREYIKKANYEGWTERGVRIRIEDISRVRQYLDELENELKEEFKNIDTKKVGILSIIDDEFDLSEKRRK